MQLLLISSSFVADNDYLEHARGAVIEFLNVCPPGEVLFVPFAAHSSKWDEYSKSGESFFGSIQQPYRAIHTCKDMVGYIKNTQLKAIFIGGGNTFLLIKTLQDKGLIELLQSVVQAGTGYMGTSAGSNVACPTIQTTNDMPIVQPASFEALNLVDFQLNPHFVSGSLVADHRGETREERIHEYHQHNDRMVIGMPEQSWIRVDNNKTLLGGGAEAVIFEKNKPNRQWAVESELS